MKKIGLLLGLLMFATVSFSQSYNHAIGLRFGNSAGGGFFGAGLNYKTALGGGNSLEFTLGGGSNHLGIDALYEWNHGLANVQGLNWYVGAGAAVNFWSKHYAHNHYGKTYSGGMGLGGIAVIGLDFNIDPLTNVPLDFALDVGPYVGLVPGFGVGWRAGFAVRYAF